MSLSGIAALCKFFSSEEQTRLMRELKEEKVKSVKVDIQNRRFTATLSEIARQTQAQSGAELAKTQLESVTTMQEDTQSVSELQLMEYQQSLRANSQPAGELGR